MSKNVERCQGLYWKILKNIDNPRLSEDSNSIVNDILETDACDDFYYLGDLRNEYRERIERMSKHYSNVSHEECKDLVAKQALFGNHYQTRAAMYNALTFKNKFLYRVSQTLEKINDHIKP